MDKYNSKTSFQKWFSSIKFENLSKNAQMFIQQYDYYSKKLDFQTTLKVLLHAVYEEYPSYREMSRAFLDQRLCREVGIESINHSNLSRRLIEMEPAVLIEIFQSLVGSIHQKQPTTKRNSLQLIDSTTIPLNQHLFPWAKFRSAKSGIKLHLNLCYLDDTHQYPEAFTITHAAIHDRTQLEVLVNKAEATYVVDRGYFDYELLDKLHDDGYFFVTRIKKNTIVSILDHIEITDYHTRDGMIISDQHLSLGGGKTYASSRFRLVTIVTKGQKILRLVTNRFDLTPQEIADIYQARWQIELFFKHLKQNLTIKKFYSRNEKGAINQVILTLIATLLTYMIKLELGTCATLFQLKRAFHYLRFDPVECWFKPFVPI